MQNFERLSSGESKFKPPVQRQHDTSTGMQEGEIHELRLSGSFLQALITFADPEVREAYNLGKVRFFSPGFSLDFTDPHTGDDIGPTLLELSFVSEPQQKNLRDPREINPGVQLGAEGVTTMADEQLELAGTEEEFDAQASFEALTGRIDALEAAFAALQEGEEEEEEEEMSAKDAEKAQLSARISELEDQNTRLALAPYELSAEETDHLVKLKRTSPVLFSAHVERLPVKDQGTGLRVQAEIGATGLTAVNGKPSLEEIVLQADAAGVKPGSGKLAFWLSANHPDRMVEVIEHLKNRN